MKVIVDRQLCEGNGMCEIALPEVFVVDENDELVVHQEAITADLLEQLEAALRSCPRRALSLED